MKPRVKVATAIVVNGRTYRTAQAATAEYCLRSVYGNRRRFKNQYNAQCRLHRRVLPIFQRILGEAQY